MGSRTESVLGHATHIKSELKPVAPIERQASRLGQDRFRGFAGYGELSLGSEQAHRQHRKEMHRLTHSHIESLHHGPTRLQVAQGRNAKDAQIHDCIRQSARSQTNYG